MADPTSTSSSPSSLTFALKWRAHAFDVTLPPTSTVLDLKNAVEQKTSVPAASVKVLGLKLSSGPPRPPVDSDSLSALAPPKAGGPRLMVMGTPAAAAAALVAAATEAAAAAVTGGGLLDEDAAADAAAAAAAQQLLDDEDDPSAIASDPDNLAKLARRISAFELKLREQPRPGARALVLDIDYTIFDLGSAAERPELLARPHLHEFITAAYAANFDIFIWSANSMKWIEVKMRELGCVFLPPFFCSVRMVFFSPSFFLSLSLSSSFFLTSSFTFLLKKKKRSCANHPEYKLTAYLDARAMVTVRSRKHGVYDCKPLPLLWAKLASHGYGPHNTLMFDDLRRNYVFNPRQGLVIRPFRKSFRSRATDREFVKLKHYVVAISGLDRGSFERLDHDRWEKWLRREGGGREALRAVEREVEEIKAALERKGGQGGGQGEEGEDGGGGAGGGTSALPPA